MEIMTYYKIFETNLKIQLMYPFNLLFSFFFSNIPVLITVLIWSAVYQSNSQFASTANMGFLSMVGYIIFANISFKLIQMNSYEISNEIRNGDLNKFIIKPVSYLKYKTTTALSSLFTNMIIYLIPFVACIVIFKISLGELMLYMLTLLFAFWINFQITVLLSTLTFWFLNVSGVFALIQFISSFLAGTLVPVNLFPKSLIVVSKVLPFQYLAYKPASIIFSPVGGSDILSYLLGASFWSIVLYVAVRILWKAGIKDYGAFGG